RVEVFNVVPALPEPLEGLRDMAYNLLWSWDDDLRGLFQRLDRPLWDATYQNPVLMLGTISQERLAERAADDSFMAYYARTYARYKEYLAERTWWDLRQAERPLVAYFSAEFGLAECLPIYSGGLGVLSGHHLKSASDLGVPLVGVGLLYQQGYFRQYLTSDGWQQESYPVNEFSNLPIRQVTDASGAPLRVALDMAGERLLVQVWRVEVGRLPLYLLDTNLPGNPEGLRDITDQLYGGDQENRIRQEIVLGVAGLRALHAMGLRPLVCHMNEGHSAFLSIERVRLLMQEQGLGFHAAREAARAGNVFTTHTPVPAGFDVFPAGLVEKYFAEHVKALGVSPAELLALGAEAANGASGKFNMAALALRNAAFVNGVSRLHGEVSRALLQKYLPDIPVDEVPIGHVTNGAHIRSAVSREMAGLFDRYLGPDWWRQPDRAETWEGIDTIPDEELWATHERRRERLVAFARRRLVRQLAARGAAQRDIERARGVLATGALTIGFARRFATYKRANLILANVERLKRILLNAERPVQIIFAGKAHPRDNEAKEVLKAVVQFCLGDEVRRSAVFVEDYDLVVARYLVQGVDVWLNTPLRGQEASGTSGMKVVPNGGLNLSILDGWWPEGYDPETGWSIGKGEDYQDRTYQDQVESEALYELLEKDVVPLFYARDADRLPRRWLARMKASMKRLAPQFSTNRMLWEYSERYYLPAARYHSDLVANRGERAQRLAAWKSKVFKQWSRIAVEGVEAPPAGARRVGDTIPLSAVVNLGALEPSDVCVEAFYGRIDEKQQIAGGRAVPLRLERTIGNGRHRFVGEVPCDRSGTNGYTLRVRPCHADANNILATGLTRWW
nr:alpha-glucan family phosphorylase [Vicinamibacterales bacterium]